MNFRRFETFVIVAIIGVIGVIYALTQPLPEPINSTQNQSQQNAQNQQQAQNDDKVQQVPSSRIQYQGVEGRNALELLKTTHRVETQEFSGIGEFVVSIDGVETDSQTNFWSFYVNGKQSPVGASQYVTKSGDVIEWKIEQIESF